MDEKAALHVAARRYCMDRDADPDVLDMRLLGPDGQGGFPFYTDNAGSIVLGAILLEVESVVPGDFASVEEMRAFLITTGRNVQVYPIRPSSVTTEDLHMAMDAARDAFCAFIERLPSEGLHHVEPLPYQRVLGLRERERLWRRLRRRWDAPKPTSYWYPLIEGPPPAHTQAFHERAFNKAIPPDLLQAILAQSRVRRVWELRTGGMHNQYEMDLILLRPWGGIGEQYWTSEKMDWLLYHSHENSLTVAGEWFLNGVKRAWPEWEHYLCPPNPHYRIVGGRRVLNIYDID